MKKAISITVILFACLYFANAQKKNESFLNNIQKKIDDAYLACSSSGDVNKLTLIRNNLGKPPKNNIVNYWIAYELYSEATFYLGKGDRKKSQNSMNEAISLLEKEDKKNAESYALLALVQSYSIQFTSGMSAGMLSNKVKSDANNALKLDSNNIRALYVLASNDYYTPVQFGGKQKVEEYLKKAISLKSQNVVNPYLPSWGKEECYILLINYYIDSKKYEEAKKYLTEGVKLFPNSDKIRHYEEILNKHS